MRTFVPAKLVDCGGLADSIIGSTVAAEFRAVVAAATRFTGHPG